MSQPYERGDESPGAPRPPVLLGCFGVVLVVFILGFAAVIFTDYLESGADDGTITLRQAESYGPGTYDYVGAENLFIVRFITGEFVALSDLDAANAANQAQRCRVSPVVPGDPAFNRMHREYEDRVQRQVRGATIYLREACNDAVYDLTGTRLDADGPNLDRHATAIDREGRLVVDTRDRTCSRRDGVQPRVDVPC